MTKLRIGIVEMRSSTRRGLALLIGIATVVVVGGIGAASEGARVPSVPHARNIALSTDVPAVRASTALSLGNGTAILSPPSPTILPAVPASVAVQAVATEATDQPQTGKASRAIFGLFNDASFGGLDSAGNVVPRYKDLPVWVIETDGAQISWQGRGFSQIGALVDSTPAQPQSDTVVRASDGKVLMTVNSD